MKACALPARRADPGRTGKGALALRTAHCPLLCPLLKDALGLVPLDGSSSTVQPEGPGGVQGFDPAQNWQAWVRLPALGASKRSLPPSDDDTYSSSNGAVCDAGGSKSEVHQSTAGASEPACVPVAGCTAKPSDTHRLMGGARMENHPMCLNIASSFLRVVSASLQATLRFTALLPQSPLPLPQDP